MSPAPAQPASADWTIRHELKPGDIGAIIRLHGVSYAREYGFDSTFEAYVAGPLAEFAIKASPRGRLWIAERAGEIVGCVAIVESQERSSSVASDEPGLIPAFSTAQLRWYLVDPSMRGRGLGRRLLTEAIEFSRRSGYEEIILWTVSALADAARLYRAAGFEKDREELGRHWGVDVIQERYRMRLTPGETR